MTTVAASASAFTSPFQHQPQQHQPLRSPISPRATLNRPKQHIRAPSNIARLQPHHESLPTLESRASIPPSTPKADSSAAETLGARKGLRPLSMSTFNLPPSTPTAAGELKARDDSKPISHREKLDRRRSMIVPTSSSSAHGDHSTTTSNENGNVTGSKLKRLSLVARPSSLELDRPSSSSYPTETIVVSSQDKTATTSPLPQYPQRYQPSTPISGSGPDALASNGSTHSRRQDRRPGLRASISYSPAATSSVYTPRTSSERRAYDDHQKHDYEYDWGLGSDLDDGYDLGGSEVEKISEDEGTEEIGASSAQTLTEKHADLLTLIAQRERRVNELRQELRHQESSLTHLKSRWTSIVSRSALSPTHSSNVQPNAQPSGTPSHSASRTGSSVMTTGSARKPRPRPVSMISTSTSSASSLSLATIDEPPSSLASSVLVLPSGGLSSTGAAVLSGIMAQTEGYLGPEVMEGGKRFLGTLWRTVGAAAGGTVPTSEEEGSSGERRERYRQDASEGRKEPETRQQPRPDQDAEWSQFGPKLDLSNIQRMITPWSTASLNTAQSDSISTPTSASSHSELRSLGSTRDRKASDQSFGHGSISTARTATSASTSRDATPIARTRQISNTSSNSSSTSANRTSPNLISQFGYPDHPMAISERIMPSLPSANMQTNLPECNGFDLLPSPTTSQLLLDQQQELARASAREKAKAKAMETEKGKQRERESSLTPMKSGSGKTRNLTQPQNATPIENLMDADADGGEGDGWGW